LAQILGLMRVWLLPVALACNSWPDARLALAGGSCLKIQA